MLQLKRAGAECAQETDHMGGSGLERVDLLHIHAAGADIAAAAGGYPISLLQRKAAVVHQKPRKLRRGEGVILLPIYLPHPCQLEAVFKADMGGSIHRCRRLKIFHCEPGAILPAEERA